MPDHFPSEATAIVPLYSVQRQETLDLASEPPLRNATALNIACTTILAHSSTLFPADDTRHKQFLDEIFFSLFALT